MQEPHQTNQSKPAVKQRSDSQCWPVPGSFHPEPRCGRRDAGTRACEVQPKAPEHWADPEVSGVRVSSAAEDALVLETAGLDSVSLELQNQTPSSHERLREQHKQNRNMGCQTKRLRT